MSAFTIVNDITLELRRRMFSSLTSASGVTLGYTDEVSNIVLSPVQDTPPANAKLSLYLYHIGLNSNLRNQRMLAGATADEQRLPPLPLELRYLATPLEDEQNNQLVLSRLLQFIYDQPQISSLNAQPLDDSFGGASSKLRITPDLMAVDQLSQLWNAFKQPFRLSMAFMVDVVAIDSAKAPRVAPRVVDVLAVAGAARRGQ
ncbi:MAG: DUF4255 domain-containing protein [Gammaproteobacteria bacterium]|nr:DUF4255 domain-containing protein [Gammaproteobacteria bacterium]